VIGGKGKNMALVLDFRGVQAVCYQRTHGWWRFELYGIVERYGVNRAALRTVIRP
jgi:hypothetical protein